MVVDPRLYVDVVFINVWIWVLLIAQPLQEVGKLGTWTLG